MCAIVLELRNNVGSNITIGSHIGYKAIPVPVCYRVSTKSDLVAIDISFELRTFVHCII